MLPCPRSPRSKTADALARAADGFVRVTWDSRIAPCPVRDSGSESTFTKPRNEIWVAARGHAMHRRDTEGADLTPVWWGLPFTIAAGDGHRPRREREPTRSDGGTWCVAFGRVSVRDYRVGAFCSETSNLVDMTLSRSCCGRILCQCQVSIWKGA
jgi:hypothetical protein